MLSVSGARGIVGRTMTPLVAARFAAALGSWIRASSDDPAPPVVCVGRDSRPSGAALLPAATAGLAATGCRVVDLGIVATPTVGVAIGHHGAAGGIVVTASHNPAPWNGLKCLDADGVAPPPDQAAGIIGRFEADDIDWATAGEVPAVERDPDAHGRHVERVLAVVDAAAIRGRGFRVVLDSVNGAGGVAGRRLLDALGCDVVHLNAEPTGRFAHPPEPVADHLGDLMDATVDAGAAVGFAQDPDADRLALVDETGAYLGEEYTLALAARRMLQRHPAGARMATNLSTSRMIDDVASAAGAPPVVRTPVGEANVVAGMKRTGATFGGEGNGGVIFPPVCWVRDSLSAMALVLDLLAAEGRPLGAVAGELPRYTMVKRKLDLADVGGRAGLAGLLDRVRRRFADARLDTADGLRVDLADGWAHVRPSNTEPIVRIIVEAGTDARAAELVEQVTAAGLGR
jgi:phosphomannomutase